MGIGEIGAGRLDWTTVLFLVASAAAAQGDDAGVVDPAPPGRPAAVPVETSMVGVDDAFTTGPSVSEVELTLVYSEAFRRDDPASDRGDDGTGVGVVTWTGGLTRRVDLSASIFGASYTDLDEPDGRSRGLGDLLVDVKWLFHGNGETGLNLAYRPGLTAPIGHRDDGDEQAPGLGFWTVNHALIATLVQQRWVLGVETGVLLPVGDRGQARGAGFVGFGTGYQVSPRVKPEIELHYLREFVDGGDDGRLLAATGGLIVNATDRIRLDLGLRVGLWSENFDQRVTVSANASFTFGATDSDSNRGKR